MISLSLTHPDGRTETHELRGEATVGRDPACTIVISHPSVSRLHARFTPSDRSLQVEDLESKAGTLLNGKPISIPADVLEGDLVTIGPSQIRVHIGVQIQPGTARHDVVFSDDAIPGLTRRIAIDAEQFSSTRRYLRDSQALGADPTLISQQLEALLSLATSLARIRDRANLLAEVARQVLDVFKEADRVILLEAEDPERPTHQQVKFVLTGPHARQTDTVELSPEVLEHAVQLREAVLHADDDAEFPVSSGERDGPRSVICAPLWSAERTLGAIYLDSRTAYFDESTLRLLTAMASIVATALQNVLLLERVRVESTQRANLARYFSKDLVDRILHEKIPYAREGEVHRATILMVDLCGFTRLTTDVPPKLLISSLNAYFAAMQRIIFRNRGTVERFGGDSILAYWGVIETDRHAAWRACFAAVSMQNEMIPLNAELAKAGTPTLSISLGINTGDVIAGDVGSEERYEFTVLGDAVNMTRRLQDLAAAGQILIGAETMRALGRSGLFRELPPQRVKGRDQPLRFGALFGVRTAAEAGVSFALCIGVFARSPDGAFESRGRVTGIRYSHPSGRRYNATLTLSLFQEPDPGPLDLALALPGGEALELHGIALGDPVESQATAYWSGLTKSEFDDQPIDIRVQLNDPEAALKGLGII